MGRIINYSIVLAVLITALSYFYVNTLFIGIDREDIETYITSRSYEPNIQHNLVQTENINIDEAKSLPTVEKVPSDVEELRVMGVFDPFDERYITTDEVRQIVLEETKGTFLSNNELDYLVLLRTSEILKRETKSVVSDLAEEYTNRRAQQLVEEAERARLGQMVQNQPNVTEIPAEREISSSSTENEKETEEEQ